MAKVEGVSQLDLL